MRTLTVENFSCIDSATLEVRRLTVIIGPQASGKSVLCKLLYFLVDCAHEQTLCIQRKLPFEKFALQLKSRFLEWFPTEAWGDKRFKIELRAGDYQIVIARKIYGGVLSEDFRIKFSNEFKEQYEVLAQELVKLDSKTTSPESLRFDLDYRLFEQSRKSIQTLMGRDNVSGQAFVPAGRSFFTSIGKAIAAFEQGRVLDPLILKFGRLYTGYRERGSVVFYGEKPAEAAFRRNLGREFEVLLGGKIERDGEKEFLRTDDGRRVPLSAMSSGQQELLPLATVLPWLVRGKEERLCYIEEPEAHLFPTAQSALIEILVGTTTTIGAGTNLVMTTHSPYVLTKINNLLYAGNLSRKLNEEKKKILADVVPRQAWIHSRNISAYAIQSRELTSILESDGLINSDYLDEVSGDMSVEFGKLLELEESLVG